jgi:hypothetical protein
VVTRCRPNATLYRVRQRGENEPLLLSQISSAATSRDHARGIGREPTVGGHEAMAAFHARAEGTLPNRCSPPLFDDDEGVWNDRVPQGEQRSRPFPLSDRCNGRNEIGEVINSAQTPTSRASRVGWRLCQSKFQGEF